MAILGNIVAAHEVREIKDGRFSRRSLRSRRSIKKPRWGLLRPCWKYRTINYADRHRLHNLHNHPTAPTTAVNATTGEAAGAGYPWLGFAHNEPPPVVLAVIETLDRGLGLGVGVHLDKAEPLAAPRVTVLDDLVLCTVPNGVNHSCRSDEDTEYVKLPTYNFFPTGFSLWQRLSTH